MLFFFFFILHLKRRYYNGISIRHLRLILFANDSNFYIQKHSFKYEKCEICYKIDLTRSIEFHLSLMILIFFFFFNFYTCRTRLSPLECCRLFCENISIPPWKQALSSVMEATAVTCRILPGYLVVALWRVGPTSLGLGPADFLSDSNPLNHGSLQLRFGRHRLIYNFIKYTFILTQY